MAQVERFTHENYFKFGLTIITDRDTRDWNFRITDYGFDWLPADWAASWTEKYDLEEDGDFAGERQYTRYLFEAASRLQVKKELLQMLQIYRNRTSRTLNRTLN